MSVISDAPDLPLPRSSILTPVPRHSLIDPTHNALPRARSFCVPPFLKYDPFPSLSQVRSAVSVTRCTMRAFGPAEWKVVRTRLATWRESLVAAQV